MSKNLLFFCFFGLLGFACKSQIIWSPISDSRFHDLDQISFADDRVGVATQGDSVFLTRDGGASWLLRILKGEDIEHCEIFVNGTDTLLIIGSGGYNSIYLTYGFQDSIRRLEIKSFKNSSGSRLTDVHVSDTNVYLLGYFSDSITDHPAILQSQDFGDTWSPKVFLGESQFLSKALPRGDDTLCVIMGQAIYTEYWSSDFNSRYNQYLPVAVSNGTCQSNGCLFVDYPPRELLWQSGNLFLNPKTIVETGTQDHPDLAFYDNDEVIVLWDHFASGVYLSAAIAYSMVDTGYAQREVYYLGDSTKALRSIAVTENYVFISSTDVIFKSEKASIGINELEDQFVGLDLFISPSPQGINVGGIPEDVRLNYELFNLAGQKLALGTVTKLENGINTNELTSQMYLLVLSTLDGPGIKVLKFIN